MSDRKTIMRYVKFFLKLAVSIAILYLVFTKIDIREVWRIVKSAHFGWLLLGVLFFILSKLIAAYRLNILFRDAGVYITDRFNLELYLLGMYYNLFLPGAVGGDGYKVIYLQKHFKTGVKKLVTVMFLDRLNGMLALFCLAILFLYFTLLPFPFKSIIWLSFPLSIVGYYLFLHLFFKDFKFSFVKVTMYSFGVQFAQSVSALAILFALGTFDHQAAYVSLFLISSIMATLPISIGGAGVREITFYYGADLFQLDQSIAVTLSLLFYLITVLVSLAGIYYLFYHPKVAFDEGISSGV